MLALERVLALECVKIEEAAKVQNAGRPMLVGVGPSGIGAGAALPRCSCVSAGCLPGCCWLLLVAAGQAGVIGLLLCCVDSPALPRFARLKPNQNK